MRRWTPSKGGRPRRRSQAGRSQRGLAGCRTADVRSRSAPDPLRSRPHLDGGACGQAPEAPLGQLRALLGRRPYQGLLRLASRTPGVLFSANGRGQMPGSSAQTRGRSAPPPPSLLGEPRSRPRPRRGSRLPEPALACRAAPAGLAAACPSATGGGQLRVPHLVRKAVRIRDLGRLPRQFHSSCRLENTHVRPRSDDAGAPETSGAGPGAAAQASGCPSCRALGFLLRTAC